MLEPNMQQFARDVAESAKRNGVSLFLLEVNKGDVGAGAVDYDRLRIEARGDVPGVVVSRKVSCRLDVASSGTTDLVAE